MISLFAIPIAIPKVTDKTSIVKERRKTSSLTLCAKYSKRSSGPLNKEGVHVRRTMGFHLIGRNTTMEELYVMARKGDSRTLAGIVTQRKELLLAN